MTPEARLSAAISAVLAKLPASVRRLLDGRWSWRLVADLGRKEDGRIILGEAWYSEGMVVISGVAVRQLTEDLLLQTLVAHEIAHLVIHYRGRDEPNDEVKVNQLVRRWGFPMDRLL